MTQNPFIKQPIQPDTLSGRPEDPQKSRAGEPGASNHQRPAGQPQSPAANENGVPTPEQQPVRDGRGRRPDLKRKPRMPKTVTGINKAERRSMESLRARFEEEKSIISAILDDPTAGRDGGAPAMPPSALAQIQSLGLAAYRNVIRLRGNLVKTIVAESKDEFIREISQNRELGPEDFNALNKASKSGDLSKIIVMLQKMKPENDQK